MKKTILLNTIILLSVFLTGLPGCSSKTAVPEVKDDDNVFLEMMSMIPDTNDTRQDVLITDFTVIQELYDVDTSEPVILTYLEDLIVGGSVNADETSGTRAIARPFISGMSSYSHAVITREKTGFAAQDVKQAIHAGEAPFRYEAITGVFDTEQIEALLVSYDNADEYISAQISSYQDTTIIDWDWGGNEMLLSKRLEPPMFDHLGRLRPVAVSEDRIFRAYEKSYLKAMLDAREKGNSLADNTDFQLIARALTRQKAYSAWISGKVDQRKYLDSYLKYVYEQSDPGSDISRSYILENIGELLRPYTSRTLAISRDEVGAVMIIILVYDSASDAQADVTIFKNRLESGINFATGEPWSTSIDNYEVWTEDRLLIATIRGDIIQRWAEIIGTCDPLLLRE